MLLFDVALALTPESQGWLDARLEVRAAETAERLRAKPESVREVLVRRVGQRLEDWPVDPTRDDLERKIVDFEATRLERYVTSGVFPKTYFGYLDTRGDTASVEWELRDHVQCVRTALNDALGSPMVTDLDLVVTFLAEGGTLMLDTPNSKRDRLHPVFDVGLDDLASGTNESALLVKAVDERCGSNLGGMVAFTPEGEPSPPGARGLLISKREGHNAWLMSDADMLDAIAGTGIMWVWEVEIANRKLLAEGRPAWTELDADGRFIAGSLVYNSGILHQARTHRAIRDFNTGSYLFRRSERNAHRRPRLNLQAPTEQLAEVLEVRRFRNQPTSWVAVYHVLQRYGAWRALIEHTDWFDAQGDFTPREKPVPPVEALPEPTGSTGCGCAQSVRPRLPSRRR